MQSHSHAKYCLGSGRLMVFVISMPICARTLRRQVFTVFNRFQSEIRCSCIFYLGEGRGTFWERAILRGRHKGFFGEVGGGNNVVCLKSRTPI